MAVKCEMGKVSLSICWHVRTCVGFTGIYGGKFIYYIHNGHNKYYAPNFCRLTTRCVQIQWAFLIVVVKSRRLLTHSLRFLLKLITSTSTCEKVPFFMRRTRRETENVAVDGINFSIFQAKSVVLSNHTCQFDWCCLVEWNDGRFEQNTSFVPAASGST